MEVVENTEHEIGGSSDRAQWFDRNEVASIDLVELALLGTRVAWP